ncbi:hypothetical protein [Streptomyces sp. AC495_CC817]|uniref:hypothetical protein n=1 Tax=Streptomyces sp. AC495_CC817 TaxID=2823900 RepID=UPI001C27677C|nr:hypothetical protein [Streptomyces sp. AC495_CC817]
MRRRARDGVDLRWLTARSWTNRWYPQGIDVGVLRGRRMLAVSWFRQDRSRTHLASRVSFVDLARPRHLDVALAVEGDAGALEPARIHTGGLAWVGDRLFAAATRQGIWEFDLSDLRTVRGAEARRLTGSSRRRALVAVRTRVHPVALRCSFLARSFDGSGRATGRVLIGEFRTDDDGRIGEFGLTDDGLAPLREFAPGIRHMQGAASWGDEVFVSQSDGLRPGALWRGAFGRLRRTAVALPRGCQDIALDGDARMLWTLGEHPWRRVVRGIPFAALGLDSAPPRARRRGPRLGTGHSSRT